MIRVSESTVFSYLFQNWLQIQALELSCCFDLMLVMCHEKLTVLEKDISLDIPDAKVICGVERNIAHVVVVSKDPGIVVLIWMARCHQDHGAKN